MTQIFPTSRCVREFYNSFLETNQLLPKAYSIAEFEAKAITVANKTLADEDTRVLLLLEACKFENFKELKIEREFLSFLKNSSYLFRFFEELANEKTAISTLKMADTYATFDEHLDILENLLQRYTKALEEKSLYDKITLPEVYEINEDFIMQHEEGFLLHLEGFLNNYEIELLSKIAKLKPLCISLHVNEFNHKMIKVSQEHFGLTLQTGYSYILDITKGKIEQEKKLSKSSPHIDIKGFSSRLLQSSFVHEKINAFVKEGIAPEDIVVVLPDESFAPTLKRLDNWRNLNFAMGESFTDSVLYKTLEALEKFLYEPEEIQHRLRFSRLRVDESIVESFKSKWSERCSADEIINLLSVFAKDENFLQTYGLKTKRELELFEEELFRLSRLLENLQTMQLQKAMKLFLNRLRSVSIDDVMGGKITVMGLLESRGVSYEGVIIVDFNDDFIPKRSKKDMFLSSHVREKANLPSQNDRENLQRYFYARLLFNAKSVAISFTQNEQSMASRFLSELGLKGGVNVDEISYMQPIFQSFPKKDRFELEDTKISYKLQDAPLSASKLKTLLTCKRWFYYKYIMKLREAKMPDSKVSEADVGNLLHESLHYVLKDKYFLDENEMMIALRRYLLSEQKSLTWRFHIDLWLSKLQTLCKNEAQRFKSGYRVYALEKEFKRDFQGYILEGKIDRIDTLENALSVIDYKSGKVPLISQKQIEKAVDFQLEFYYLLAKSLGDVEGVYYYELQSGMLTRESFLEEKLEKLSEILEEFKEPITEFPKCESSSPCVFCPYVILCGRE